MQKLSCLFILISNLGGALDFNSFLSMSKPPKSIQMHMAVKIIVEFLSHVNLKWRLTR